jgi:hypothetical protein
MRGDRVRHTVAEHDAQRGVLTTLLHRERRELKANGRLLFGAVREPLAASLERRLDGGVVVLGGLACGEARRWVRVRVRGELGWALPAERVRTALG